MLERLIKRTPVSYTHLVDGKFCGSFWVSIRNNWKCVHFRYNIIVICYRFLTYLNVIKIRSSGVIESLQFVSFLLISGRNFLLKHLIFPSSFYKMIWSSHRTMSHRTLNTLNAPQSFFSVSYTHLDVYKRQLQHVYKVNKCKHTKVYVCMLIFSTNKDKEENVFVNREYQHSGFKKKKKH